MADKNTPKVLWVVPVPDIGGVARHTLDMARNGIPGYEPVVLAPPGQLTNRLEATGVRIIKAQFGPDYGFISSLKALNAAIKTEQPAFIHSHLAYADITAATAVNLLKARRVFNRSVYVPRLVTTEHGIAGNNTLYNGTMRSFWMNLVHRMRLRGTDAVIAVSHSTAEQMKRKWGARNVEIIYNGVDTDSMRSRVNAYRVPAAPDAPRILSLSRLSPEKGIDTLLEAFAQVRQHYPRARLEIAGVGELSDRLQARAEELHLGSTVTFSGFVCPIKAMGRSDMVVQLSTWENCSYTLLDAKAAGLKVVATAVGGNTEIAADTELVDTGATDLPEAVSARIADQININPATPPEFNWLSTEAMVRATAQVYDRHLLQVNTA